MSDEVDQYTKHGDGLAFDALDNLFFQNGYRVYTIVFHGDHIPEAGQEVRIAYEYL